MITEVILYAVLAINLINAVGQPAMIGKERKPVTPRGAALNIGFSLVMVAFIVLVLVRG